MDIDINLVRNAITVASFVAFLGILWWAYAPKRKATFDKNALVPFEGEEQ